MSSEVNSVHELLAFEIDETTKFEANDSDAVHVDTVELRTINWEEINRPLPPPQFVIEGLIVEGTIGLLVGAPSARKTFIAQDMALAVASGQPFLGLRTLQCDAIYLDWENGEPRMRRRFQRLREGRGLPSRGVSVRLASSLALHVNDERFVGKLRSVLKGRSLIVIDGLAAASPGVDENDAEIRRHLDALRPLAVEGHTIVILHHTKKLGGARPSADSIRGSSALVDVVDWAILVFREEQDTALRFVKNRDIEISLELFVRLSEKGGGVTLERVAPSERKLAMDSSKATDILQLVRRQSGQSQAELVKAVGGRRQDTIASINALVQQGVLVARKEGRRLVYEPAPSLVLNEEQSANPFLREFQGSSAEVNGGSV